MNKYINKLNESNKTTFLKELYQTGLMNDVPIIGDDSLMTVLSIMKAKQAKEILEIGTAIAYSAISFVSDDEMRHVDTIERDETMYKEAMKNVSLMNYQEKINIIFEDANLVDTNNFVKKYDVIFIDAAKAQYQKFFEKYIPFLKDDGIVITDNILFHGCVEQVVFNDETTNKESLSKNVRKMAEKLDVYNHYLNTLSDYKTYYLNIGDGLAITVKK